MKSKFEKWFVKYKLTKPYQLVELSCSAYDDRTKYYHKYLQDMYEAYQAGYAQVQDK